MKNLGIISWAVVLCCLLAGPSPALAFQWRGVSVTLPKGWEVSDKGARLTLETTRNGVVCLIKILAKPMTPKPVSDYQAWLDQYSAQWASFKFTNSVLDLQGPLTIYGHEHCPMASGQKKSMAVYQFLPRVESRIYSIVVNLEPYDQKTIPQFAADILEQISFAGHGGKIAATPGIPLEDAPDTKSSEPKQAQQPYLPPPDLSSRFTGEELEALDRRVASVSALCERGDRQGITALMLKDQQEMMAQALENCSTEDLARFGRALKSRRVQAAGTRLVEYEITNGEHTHAVSFINMDGEWYLYHF